MQCTQCLVTPAIGNGWTTKVGNMEYGPYLSRDMAVRIAISEALQRRRKGVSAQVVVKDAGGEVVAKRCLCTNFGR